MIERELEERIITDGIVLFGAGQNGIWCLDYLRRTGYTVNNFIDNSLNIQGKYINDVLVLSLDEFMKNPKGVILITAKHAVIPIMNSLLNYNFKISFDRWFYQKNKHDYDIILNSFEDEKSKICLEKIIATMLTGNEKYCAQIAYPDQYFCVPNFFNTGNEIFVDCGSYTGDTIEKFIQSQNGGFKHIYGFEPGKHQVKACKKRVKRLVREWALNNHSITIENYGVGEKDDVMFISKHNSLQSTLSYNTDKNKDKVKVISLDNYFAGKSVSFIKADIEGFETAMLKGAEETIKRNKPKCALSTYHCPDDLIRIFYKLRNLVPEYKFALRHHSSMLMDTTLYAWIED